MNFIDLTLFLLILSVMISFLNVMDGSQKSRVYDHVIDDCLILVMMQS